MTLTIKRGEHRPVRGHLPHHRPTRIPGHHRVIRERPHTATITAVEHTPQLHRRTDLIRRRLPDRMTLTIKRGEHRPVRGHLPHPGSPPCDPRTSTHSHHLRHSRSTPPAPPHPSPTRRSSDLDDPDHQTR